MRKLTLVLVGFGLILFASCGGGAKKTESAVQDEPQQEMQEEVQQAEEPALDLIKDYYNVTSTPTIIFDYEDKREGFVNLGELVRMNDER